MSEDSIAVNLQVVRKLMNSKRKFRVDFLFVI